MKLEDVRFPVYVVHTDEVVTQDGILWCADAVVDDKNISGDSIGQRRLKTPLKKSMPTIMHRLCIVLYN